MPQTERYNAMPVKPSLPLVLHRLGHKKGMPDNGYLEYTTDLLEELLPFCRPNGLYKELAVLRENEKGIQLEHDITLPHCAATKALGKVQRVAFMASTVPPDFAKAQLPPNELAAEVILDALLSECADAGLDWIMEYKQRPSRSPLFTASAHQMDTTGTLRRISPGYGGLPLCFQKAIYDTLNADSLGITLTENYMLLPEKSVFAIAGVTIS